MVLWSQGRLEQWLKDPVVIEGDVWFYRTSITWGSINCKYGLREANLLAHDTWSEVIGGWLPFWLQAAPFSKEESLIFPPAHSKTGVRWKLAPWNDKWNERSAKQREEEKLDAWKADFPNQREKLIWLGGWGAETNEMCHVIIWTPVNVRLWNA